MLLAIALAAISYFAFSPHPIPVLPHNDKIKHMAAFLTLASLTDFSFPRSRFGVGKIAWLLAYGVLIEVVQYFIPNRSSEVLDVAADSIGILCYVILIPALQRLPFVRERWRDIG